MLLWLAACIPGPAFLREECSSLPHSGTAEREFKVVDGECVGVPLPFLRVFVTSAEYPGDLVRETTQTDGLAAGDELCARAASASDLPGTYRAWLSAPGTDAIDRITGEGPWKIGSRRAFPNRDALRNPPAIELDEDEFGEYVRYDQVAWTGTRPGGERDGTRHCEGWTSSAAAAEGAVFDLEFGAESPRECNGRNHLICFEIE